MAFQPGTKKDSSFRAISTVPSINKTPGPGTPPLPYPVTNDLSSSSGTVSSVRFNGCPAFVMNESTIPSVMGDQPGSLGGIKSGTVGGKVEPTKGSGSVRAGSNWIVRPLDPCTLNSGNTIGIFVFAPLPPVIIPGQSIQRPSRPVKDKTEAEASFIAQRKAAGLDKTEPGTQIQGLGKVPDLSKAAALSGATGALAKAVTTPPGKAAPLGEELEQCFVLLDEDGNPVQGLSYHIKQDGVNIHEGELGTDGATKSFPMDQKLTPVFWLQRR